MHRVLSCLCFPPSISDDSHSDTMSEDTEMPGASDHGSNESHDDNASIEPVEDEESADSQGESRYVYSWIC